jgi:hypothetical protein
LVNGILSTVYLPIPPLRQKNKKKSDYVFLNIVRISICTCCEPAQPRRLVNGILSTVYLPIPPLRHKNQKI